MNERQLAAAFRDLDAPVTPDPAFANALFTDLRAQSRRHRTQRLGLLLVAALLLVLAIGLAIVGSQPENRLQNEVVPSPSAPTYIVSVPDGADPASDPLAVEAALDSLQGVPADLRQGRRIDAMEWLPAAAEHTLPDGSAFSSEQPYWLVSLLADDEGALASGDPTLLFLYVADGTLEFLGSNNGDPVPDATLAPVPSLDPEQLLLVTPDGDSIEPQEIPVADPELRPSVDRIAVHGDAVWAWITFPYGGGEPYLLRVDPDTGVTRTVALSDGRLPSVFVPGTGPEPTSLPAVGEGPVALDEHGLWVTEPDGITLVNPVTGKVIRTIPTLEGEGHSYRRIWEPPAFGSLWDYDRGTHVVRRVDPVTGKTQIEIPITADVDHESCGDPRPLRGITGSPDLLAARCKKLFVLVDPATNRFLRTVPAGELNDVVAAGAWLSGDAPGYGPGEEPWQEPGGLVRLDPDGGPATPVFTLNQERTGVASPVVAGDVLWFLAAVRPGPDMAYEEQPRLVRVPLEALGLERVAP